MKSKKRLLLSLRVLQLEIELIHLRESLSSISDDKGFGNNREITKDKDIDRLHTRVILEIRRQPDNSIEFLVRIYDRRKLAIRIDSSKNHKRPHLHIDIDGKHHVTTIAIDTGEKLAGELQNKILKLIQDWIIENKETLLNIWNEVQSGKRPDELNDLLTDIEL